MAHLHLGLGGREELHDFAVPGEDANFFRTGQIQAQSTISRVGRARADQVDDAVIESVSPGASCISLPALFPDAPAGCGLAWLLPSPAESIRTSAINTAANFHTG